MSALGKLIVCTLLAYASAMPKIQHRADGNSGFDLSQYFNNEKFQEYLKENPSALNYFNLPSQQSPTNNAIQSDVMEDNNQQYGSVPDWQKYVRACMQQQNNPFSSASSTSTSSSTSTATSGTKAESYPNPFTNGFNQQQFSGYGQQYSESYQKCLKEWQSAASQGGYSPDFSSYYQGFNAPGGFSPSSGFNFPNAASSTSSNNAASSA